MTSSTLKERFARRGRIRDIGRVRSGSPVSVVLLPADRIAKVRTIDATMALVRRHASPLKAKRAIEAMLERGYAPLRLPKVEDERALASELGKAGVTAKRVRDHEQVDVKAVREQLQFTQEDFATLFGVELRTVQNWEQGQKPDAAANTLLRAIASNPLAVAEALQVDLAV